MSKNIEVKRVRCEKANELLETIGTCGRNFFAYSNRNNFSKFEVDHRGRIWFIDGYKGARIYLHYKYWSRGFTQGGTMRNLVNGLKAFIINGNHIYNHLGPWPDWLQNGDLWGYGEDMQIVRDKAKELGIIKE